MVSGNRMKRHHLHPPRNFGGSSSCDSAGPRKSTTDWTFVLIWTASLRNSNHVSVTCKYVIYVISCWLRSSLPQYFYRVQTPFTESTRLKVSKTNNFLPELKRKRLLVEKNTCLVVKRISDIHLVLSEKHIGHVEVSAWSVNILRSPFAASMINLR